MPPLKISFETHGRTLSLAKTCFQFQSAGSHGVLVTFLFLALLVA